MLCLSFVWRTESFWRVKRNFQMLIQCKCHTTIASPFLKVRICILSIRKTKILCSTLFRTRSRMLTLLKYFCILLCVFSSTARSFMHLTGPLNIDSKDAATSSTWLREALHDMSLTNLNETLLLHILIGVFGKILWYFAQRIVCLQWEFSWGSTSVWSLDLISLLLLILAVMLLILLLLGKVEHLHMPTATAGLLNITVPSWSSDARLKPA